MGTVLDQSFGRYFAVSREIVSRRHAGNASSSKISPLYNIDIFYIIHSYIKNIIDINRVL